METIIWILVILAVLVIIILTVITSVGKFSNKFVDKYFKEEKKTGGTVNSHDRKHDGNDELKR